MLDSSNFSAEIILYKGIPNKPDSDIEYSMRVKLSGEIGPSSFNNETFEVTRTFSEFEKLHEAFLKVSKKVPMFPAKNIFRLTEAEKLERKEQLSSYLKFTLQVPELLNNEVTFSFFKLGENASLYLAPGHLQAQAGSFPGPLVFAHQVFNDPSMFWLIFNDNPLPKNDSVSLSSFIPLFSKKGPSRSQIALSCIRPAKNASVLSYAFQENLNYSATCLVYSPESLRVFVGSDEGSITGYTLIFAKKESKKFEDLQRLEKTFTCSWHSAMVREIVGVWWRDRIISIGRDKKVITTDIIDSKGMQVSCKQLAGEITCLVRDENQGRAIVGWGSGQVTFYSANDSSPLHTFKASFDSQVVSIAIPKKQKYLFVAGENGICDCYDFPGFNKVRTQRSKLAEKGK